MGIDAVTLVPASSPLYLNAFTGGLLTHALEWSRLCSPLYVPPLDPAGKQSPLSAATHKARPTIPQPRLTRHMSSQESPGVLSAAPSSLGITPTPCPAEP